MLNVPSVASSSLDPEVASPIVRVSGLVGLPFLQHGFSTRTCGNLATRYGPPAEVGAARRTFARVAGIDAGRVAHFALTHSSRVGLVSDPDSMPIDSTPHRISVRGLLADASPRDLSFINAQGIPNQQGVDSLITTTRNLALFMVVGDAAPVIITTRQGKAVALVNVGLVGTVNNVLENTIEALCHLVACQASDLIVGIGPTVGPCCYALAQSLTWAQVVSPAFFQRHGPNAPGIIIRDEQYFFDLPRMISFLLEQTGVQTSNIHSIDLCTACPDTAFFGHYAGVAGRFGALVALR